MKTIHLIVLLLPLIFAGKCSEKYSAKTEEDCMVLTTWDESKETDTATCFCIDDNFNGKTKDQVKEILMTKINGSMVNHPLKQTVIDYVNTNIADIVKLKEYEMPIPYCRGYSATNPSARARIEKKFEENRVGRLKCESNQ